MSNQKAENREMTRHLRKEMARFAIDSGEVQIGVSHGNITLHGRIRAIRGNEEAFEASLVAMLKMLRAQRGVRDVTAAWTIVY